MKKSEELQLFQAFCLGEDNIVILFFQRIFF